jgi:hypothetical protein
VKEELLPAEDGEPFSFSNRARCPRCGIDLTSALPGDIYYVILGRRLDPSEASLWKHPAVWD